MYIILSVGAIVCVTGFGGASDNVVESAVAAKVNSPEPEDHPSQAEPPKSSTPSAAGCSNDHDSVLTPSVSGWLVNLINAYTCSYVCSLWVV